MTYDRTRLTLGQLLTSEDTTIKRNAMSILKTLSGCDHKTEHGYCVYCFRPTRPQFPCEKCGSSMTDTGDVIVCDNESCGWNHEKSIT